MMNCARTALLRHSNMKVQGTDVLSAGLQDAVMMWWFNLVVRRDGSLPHDDTALPLGLSGSVCSIFTSMTKEQSFFYESMDKLNGFLRSKLVNVTDPELCGQLRMFYRFVAGATATTQMQSILGTLSPSLRGSLAWTVWPPV